MTWTELARRLPRIWGVLFNDPQGATQLPVERMPLDAANDPEYPANDPDYIQ